MANVPISKMQVPGSEDTLLLRDSTAANKVQSATNGNLAKLDANGNLADSGIASSTLEAITNVYGSKNLFNPDTFVYGIINYVNGNVESSSWWITSDFIACSGSVVISGWKDGVEDNFCVRFAEYDANKGFIKNTSNINIASASYYSDTITLDSNTRYIRATFGFNNKITIISDFFATNRIMLRDARISDSTYVPYAMTNRELTERIKKTVVNISSASISPLGYDDTLCPIVAPASGYRVLSFYFKSNGAYGTYLIWGLAPDESKIVVSNTHPSQSAHASGNMVIYWVKN